MVVEIQGVDASAFWNDAKPKGATDLAVLHMSRKRECHERRGTCLIMVRETARPKDKDLLLAIMAPRINGVSRHW